MKEGLRRLYTGDFNHMSQHKEADDSITIMLSKMGEPTTYKFCVKDLYGKDEKVLSHEVIDSSKQLEKKPWIAERMHLAKAEKDKEDKIKKEKNG